MNNRWIERASELLNTAIDNGNELGEAGLAIILETAKCYILASIAEDLRTISEVIESAGIEVSDE